MPSLASQLSPTGSVLLADGLPNHTGCGALWTALVQGPSWIGTIRTSAACFMKCLRTSKCISALYNTMASKCFFYSTSKHVQIGSAGDAQFGCFVKRQKATRKELTLAPRVHAGSNEHSIKAKTLMQHRTTRTLSRKERKFGFLVSPCLCSGCSHQHRTIWRDANEAGFRKRCIKACILDSKCLILMINSDSSTCYLYHHNKETVKQGLHGHGFECFVKTSACIEGVSCSGPTTVPHRQISHGAEVPCNQTKKKPTLQPPGAAA